MLIPGIFRYIMALSVWETADGRILCTGILPYRAVRHLPTHMLISKKENVMKKAIVLSLALTLALGMTGCAKTAVSYTHLIKCFHTFYPPFFITFTSNYDLVLEDLDFLFYLKVNWGAG